MNVTHPPASTRGFSLVELTIVLVIVALLASGLMFGISAQRDAADQLEAQRQLEAAREALLAFAMSNGRLPCPARPNLATGTEDCALQHGVLPWATLSLPMTDPWGRRLTYYASSAFTGAVPAGSLASFSMATNGNANVRESSATTNNLASDLPAVIVSHGSRGAGAWLADGTQISGVAGDEAENADADLLFFSRPPGPAFDDLVVWVAPAILKARMVAAGRLP